MHLFDDAPPVAYDDLDGRGNKITRIRKSGYAMVWLPEYRDATPRRHVFKVGIRTIYRQALQEAYKQAGYREEAAGGPYIVDLDNHACHHFDGSPCPHWKGNGERWCSHQLGVAHWLTKAYVVGKQTGIILFERKEADGK